MRLTAIQAGLFLCCIIFGIPGLHAQVSPDCDTAIPICSNTPVNGGTLGYGTDDFIGAGGSGCLELSQSGLVESNSAWYRFRTGASGQLGFNIGFDPSEDWDFALYRASDCGSLGDPVRCDFLDNSNGNAYIGVGVDPTGDTENFQYDSWLEVGPGEDYFLLINNFTNSNSGFSIQFTGQIFADHPQDALDCSIVNNLLGSPVAACEGDQVPLDATTPGALEYRWFADTGNGFQHIIGEDQPVFWATESARYRVQVFLPGGSQIFSEVQVGFGPSPLAGQVSDEVRCGPGERINLREKDAEILGGQAAADFRVSYHLNPEDAGTGANPLPPLISLPEQPITLYVRLASVAYPDCYDASASFTLQGLAEPILDFPGQAYICAQGGSARIGPEAAEAGVEYRWDSGESTAAITVYGPGTYTLTAIRSSAGTTCERVRSVEVLASATPAIRRIDVSDLRKENRIEVIPETPGNFEYALNSGPYQESPVFDGVPPGNHVLHMRDTLGCGAIRETITVVGFPLFFTPNGDGVNDRWEVFGLEQLSDPQLNIFDRYGKLLRQLDLQHREWDGTYNGRLLPSADYWFRLEYTDASGQRQTARFLNAHFSLKR